MQERGERHNRIVDHMPTYRNAHRSGEGSPEEAISAEHSRTSRVMADTTYSAD